LSLNTFFKNGCMKAGNCSHIVFSKVDVNNAIFHSKIAEGFLSIK